MGQAGSSLTSKAVVDPLLMRYTAMEKEDIINIRMRHFHDLGGRFALGRDQFSSLLNGLQKSDSANKDKIHSLFDTDRNQYVDSSEIISSLTMLSRMLIEDKIDVIHSLYDFNGSGDLSIDEMTMLLRTVAVGCSKMDRAIRAPTTRETEELAKLAFRKADLDSDGAINRRQFDDFCMSNPTVRGFLDYWADGSNQVAIARGELFLDADFPPGGSSLYFNVADTPDGMLPSECVLWLRPKQFCPGTPKLYADGSLGAFVGAGGRQTEVMGRREVGSQEVRASAVTAAAAAAVHGVGTNGVGCIKQGQIADLWFLNALSLVASRPPLLRKLFVATGQEKQGRFCIQFFKEERWRNVPLDDCLPCNALGTPIFATSTDQNEIWPMLVEKAYAKLHGCYASIVHGQVQYALRDLTGGTVERIALHKADSEQVRPEMNSDEFWEKLKEWAGNSTGGVPPNQDHVVGVAWTVPTNESIMEGGTLRGLQFEVMHTVLAAVEYKQFRLVRVRNPWPGGTYFEGDWSNGSEVWLKAPKELVELALAASSDGSNARAPPREFPGSEGRTRADKFTDSTAFWMVVDDFVKHFDTLVVAHLHEPAKSTANNVVPVSKAKLVASAPRDSSGAGGWSHQFRRVTFPTSGGGCPGSLDPRASWNRNPQFFLEVPEPCDVCISLSQRDTRFHGGTASDGDRPSLGLLLHRWAWGADITRVRCLERLHGDEDVAGNFDPGNSMLRVRGDSPTGLVVRSEPFRNTREVHVSAKVQPGQYVIVPMTYDPSTGAKNASAARTAAAPSVGRHGAPEFWLSVFGKSPLHPIKLFSDGEVEWEDRSRSVEGVDDLFNIFNEERIHHEKPDIERDNETVALEALSTLVGKMWMVCKQLEFRKLDLEAKITILEEEKHRKDEEAAEAAAAAAADAAMAV